MITILNIKRNSKLKIKVDHYFITFEIYNDRNPKKSSDIRGNLAFNCDHKS